MCVCWHPAGVAAPPSPPSCHTSTVGGADAPSKTVSGVVLEVDYRGIETVGGRCTTLWAMIETECMDLLVHPWTGHLLNHKWRCVRLHLHLATALLHSRLHPHPFHRQFGRAAFQRGILLYFVWLAAFTVSSFLYRHDHHAFNFDTTADGARVVADIIVVVLNV